MVRFHLTQLEFTRKVIGLNGLKKKKFDPFVKEERFFLNFEMLMQKQHH